MAAELQTHLSFTGRFIQSLTVQPLLGISQECRHIAACGLDCSAATCRAKDLGSAHVLQRQRSSALSCTSSASAIGGHTIWSEQSCIRTGHRRTNSRWRSKTKYSRQARLGIPRTSQDSGTGTIDFQRVGHCSEWTNVSSRLLLTFTLRHEHKSAASRIL